MTFLLLALGLLLGAMAFIRFAPSDPAVWHIDLINDRPAEIPITLMPPGSDPVRQGIGHAWADVILFSPGEANDMLNRIDQIAGATPRTTRLAGSVQEGHITWVSRSRFWGFPDYITAQITPAGLTLYARLRFGRNDFGVNAARLRAWLSHL